MTAYNHLIMGFIFYFKQRNGGLGADGNQASSAKNRRSSKAPEALSKPLEENSINCRTAQGANATEKRSVAEA
jgi:hypothetical protein